MNNTILLVEDDESLAKAMASRLKHANYEIMIAHNGAAALQLLSAGPFKVILLDLLMPIVDGFEFLHVFRKKDLVTPVIVLSNLGQVEDMAHAKQLGAQDYLIKANTSLEEVARRVAAVGPIIE